MQVDKKNALTGALLSDAAALGLHWLYDQEQIARVEATGSILFRQPDINIYEGRKGYFAQGGRHAGELSHYGESARLVGQLCLNGQYSTDAHRQSFLAAFGPCGTFNGYADRPTKALVARMLIDADKIKHPSGVDDDQMPGLCPVPGVFAAGLPLDTALSSVQVISINQQVIDSASILFNCLQLLGGGMPLPQALEQSAQSGAGPIHDLIKEAIAQPDYRPLDVANHYSLACHVPQGMPVAWHLLYHAESFEMAVRDNIRCGGDSCGRSMIIGAIAGMAFEIPGQLLSQAAYRAV